MGFLILTLHFLADHFTSEKRTILKHRTVNIKDKSGADAVLLITWPMYLVRIVVASVMFFIRVTMFFLLSDLTINQTNGRSRYFFYESWSCWPSSGKQDGGWDRSTIARKTEESYGKEFGEGVGTAFNNSVFFALGLNNNKYKIANCWAAETDTGSQCYVFRVKLRTIMLLTLYTLIAISIIMWALTILHELYIISIRLAQVCLRRRTRKSEKLKNEYNKFF